MKTLRISMLALMLTFSGQFVMAGGPNASGTPDRLHLHLSKKIDYPRFARESGIEGIVLVSFSVDSSGYIRVNQINSSDVALARYIEQKLSEIRLCPFDASAGEEHNIKFNFHLKTNS
jgi:hypothetical protein